MLLISFRKFKNIVFSFFFLIVMSFTTFCGDTTGIKPVNLAVLNLKNGSGVTEGDCEIITDRLRSDLFITGKVNVMERSQMQEILKEQGFQQSGACTDNACLVQMGELLGVNTLVGGSIGKIGSICMINLREIDVQTARITKVVSKDIRGEIEDVVAFLPEIAGRLVNDSVETPPEPEISRKDSLVKSEAKDIQIVVEKEMAPEMKPVPKTPAVQEKPDIDNGDDDDLNNSNRNRAGIGVEIGFLGTKYSHFRNGRLGNTIHLVINKKGWFEDPVILNIDRDGFDVERTSFQDILVHFHIKAGPVINISIGPGIMIGKEKYTESNTGDPDVFKIDYSIYYFHTGLNIVKRWYPLKINLGLFADWAMPVTHYSIDYDMKGSFLYCDAHDFDYRVIPGCRVGAEILVGSHLGINVDFLYQSLKYETKFDFNEFGLIPGAQKNPDRQEIKLPPAGIGLGFNVYF